MRIDLDGAPQHRERVGPVGEHVGQRHLRSSIKIVTSMLSLSEAAKAAVVGKQVIRVRMSLAGLAHDIPAGRILSPEHIERVFIEAEAHVIRSNLDNTL